LARREKKEKERTVSVSPKSWKCASFQITDYDRRFGAPLDDLTRLQTMSWTEWISKQPWKTRYKILGLWRSLMWPFRKKQKRDGLNSLVQCINCKRVFIQDKDLSCPPYICEHCMGKPQKEDPHTTCVCGRHLYFSAFKDKECKCDACGAITRMVSQEQDEYKEHKVVKKLSDLVPGMFVAHKSHLRLRSAISLLSLSPIYDEKKYYPTKKYLILEYDKKKNMAIAVNVKHQEDFYNLDDGGVLSFDGEGYRVFKHEEGSVSFIRMITIYNPDEWVIV
jgi:hypothetical protein